MVLQLPDLFEAGLQTAETSKYTQMFGSLAIESAGPRGAACLMTVLFLGGHFVTVLFGVYGKFFVNHSAAL